jgi:FkbM family methyltransferase
VSDAGGLVNAGPPLSALLDRDAASWRAELDERFGVLDEVLAGQRAAVVYPAARMGRRAARGLAALGVRVVAFGDRDTAMQGRTIDGLTVLSPDDVAASHSRDAILVASTMFDSAICEDLRARGCDAVVPVGYLNLRLPDVFRAREYEGACAAAVDRANRSVIEAACALMADDESRRVFAGRLEYYLGLDKAVLDRIRSAETIYFDPSVYSLADDEIVVDGGAYVGDTLRAFLRSSSGRYRGYVAFEPDKESYAALARVAAGDPQRITAVPAGLGRHTSSARLLRTASADSRLLGDGEPGGESVSIVGLDDYFAKRPAPTLLKLDIEGWESEALLGAARLMKDSAPKLAISAYHLPSDLWTLPLLIERLMPGSRMYLRHYSREVDDTVCYALPVR